MGADVALFARGFHRSFRGNPLVSRQPPCKPRPSEKSRHARRDERARKPPQLLHVSRPTFPHSALFSKGCHESHNRNPLRSSAFLPNVYSLAVTKRRGHTLDFWTFSEQRDEGESDEEESIDALFQTTTLTPCAGVALAMTVATTGALAMTTWATARRTQGARTRGMLPLNTQRKSEQKPPRPLPSGAFCKSSRESPFGTPLGTRNPLGNRDDHRFLPAPTSSRRRLDADTSSPLGRCATTPKTNITDAIFHARRQRTRPWQLCQHSVSRSYREVSQTPAQRPELEQGRTSSKQKDAARAEYTRLLRRRIRGGGIN